jgi:hypothetical protein
MADLGITCPSSTTVAGGGVGGGVDVDRVSLIRTGDTFPANTTLDLNSPGGGWSTAGGPVTISGAQQFVDQTQVYRNGILQLPGLNAGADNDVYFISNFSSIAFEMDIRNLDVVQVWHFAATTSG